MRIKDDVSRMSRHSLEVEVRRIRATLNAPEDAIIHATTQTPEALFSKADVEYIENIRDSVQSNYAYAVMGVVAAAAALVGAGISDNGADTRRAIRLAKGSLITELDRLKDTIRDTKKYEKLGISFDFDLAESLIPVWKNLYNAADQFVAAGETDEAKAVFRHHAAAYNPNLKDFAKPLSRRGKRDPYGVQALLLKRIDKRIYNTYKPGDGYEQTALSVAAAYRNEGDVEAAEYIDKQKNKRQFVRDARNREERRRKLVCVE